MINEKLRYRSFHRAWPSSAVMYHNGNIHVCHPNITSLGGKTAKDIGTCIGRQGRMTSMYHTYEKTTIGHPKCGCAIVENLKYKHLHLRIGSAVKDTLLGRYY